MSDSLQQILQSAETTTGETLDALSRRSAVLVVFLRHGGCPFCRQMLADLAEKRAQIEQSGTALVLVHMMDDAAAAVLFKPFGLDNVARISDPDRRIYAGFGLRRGNVSQVMGPRVWWRGLKATVVGHRPGIPAGDIYQMPGAFLIADGQILRRFEPQTTADRADFEDLTTCPLPPNA